MYISQSVDEHYGEDMGFIAASLWKLGTNRS